jgi:hypothetical protein
MANLKDLSRGSFSADNQISNIGISALMRIADATEIMAKNYVKMQNDLDYCNRRIREQNEEIAGLKRSNAALKGHLTRYKK